MLAAKQDQTLLDHDNHSLIVIDHQPRVGLSAQPNHATPIRQNVVMVSKAANEQHVPILVTSIAEQPDTETLIDVKPSRFPDNLVSDLPKGHRLEWLVQWVTSAGRNVVVLAGVRTSVSIYDSALSALDQGVLVYIIVDACGDVSEDAHQRAMKQLVRQGAHPITSLQYLLELR